jgi:hypothetical protein
MNGGGAVALRTMHEPRRASDDDTNGGEGLYDDNKTVQGLLMTMANGGGAS